MFLKRSVPVDVFIMKPNQGNIVLGRDFLRAMKGFIDVGKDEYAYVGRQKVCAPFLRETRMSFLKTLLKSLEILTNPKNFDLIFLLCA